MVGMVSYFKAVLGCFLSGLVGLHAVLGCCIHHRHLADVPQCCQFTRLQERTYQCREDATEWIGHGHATCCSSAIGGTVDGESCRERCCDWGLQVPSRLFALDLATGLVDPGISGCPPRGLNRGRPSVVSPSPGLDLVTGIRRHAVLAVFLL